MNRDCPKCGTTFGSVNDNGVCPFCNYRFRATPTQFVLAGSLGVCDADGLLSAIAAYHQVPALLSLNQPICEVLRKRIPETIAREFPVIPVIVDGRSRIAVSDPLNERLVEVLTTIIGHVPDFAVAHNADILRRINESYGCIGGDSADAWT